MSDRVRTNGRLLASRWAARLAEAPAGAWLQDATRSERLAREGIDALGASLVGARIEPLAEFAARLSGEAFALQAPLHEVVRVLLQLKPLVLDLWAPPATTPPDAASLELLDRVVSAAVLESVRRYERQRQRRTLATQEQVEALRDRLRRHVIIDGLTGLYNANHFPVAVRREVRRSRRFGRVFSLAVVSLEPDDEIRDAWGEENLRAVTLQLADILARATRQVDVRAALGAGRFGLILPETPLAGAAAVADRIRRTVESRPVQVERPHRLMHSVSIGLACFPQDGHDDAALLARLEESLAGARAAREATVAAPAPRP